jgi:hypothetical protein
MRELALCGFIAVVFGLGSYYATDHLGAFSLINLGLGGLGLAAALVLGTRRVRLIGGPHSRPLILRGLARVALAVLIAVGAERASYLAGVRFDWTFEQRYELEPALVSLVERQPGLEAFLFYDPLDPRIRRTRLLLEEIARHGEVATRAYELEQVPDELDRYAIGSSNSLLFRRGERFQVVERPTEGAIYEALYRLLSVEAGVIALLRGEGEGDPEDERELGFGGLASMLVTEGYVLRSLVTMSLREVPEDVDVVLALGPQRRIHTVALDALRRFLARGGGLVALLEPGRESGIEQLLAEWGLHSPDQVVIDPASGEGSGSEARGACPLVYVYETHPVTAGLDRNRMTFFCGARAFRLRKPRVEDALTAVAQSSHRAWLTDDLGVLSRRGGEVEHRDEPTGYQPLAVTGHYQREGSETRIFAVGDRDFASNRYLRTLYNLDLILNGVHWTAEREPQIQLRPKIRTTVQFPLPVADSLQMLYGVGLLVPEALLIAGGLVWLRRRAA